MTTYNLSIKDRIYFADVTSIQAAFREFLEVEPTLWKCPCVDRCGATVVFGRCKDGRIHFMCTQSFTVPPVPTIYIENVEDIAMFLQSDLLDPRDLYVYSSYFRSGFKEALLAA